MLSFGFSLGDIILCAKIARQLYSSLTDGRKNAPCDLKDLQNILLGLYCSLNHLHRASQKIFARAEYILNQDVVPLQQQLGFMIYSCLHTLYELEKVTRKYRQAAYDPPPLSSSPYAVAGVSFSTHFREQAKIQWRRFLWDLKGDSFCRYRERLQSHTDAINILLNTFTWFVFYLFSSRLRCI